MDKNNIGLINNIQVAVCNDFEFTLPDKGDFGKFRTALISRIQDLINHDFEKLLWILYRVDVSESKAKNMLAQNPDKQAEVLADLVIDRQIQKATLRKQFTKPKTDDRDADLLM